MKLAIQRRGRRAAFCISHVQPFFALPANVNLIQTAPFESGAHTISLPAYLRERDLWNSPIPAMDYGLVLLGEIARQWRHEIDYVVVLLHRKLCTTQPLGKPDAAFGNMWLAAGDSVDLEAELARYPNDVVTALPFFFADGLVGQYGRCHLVQDFWRLLAICVDAGLLSSSEAVAFCSEKVLLWGPTMGQLPVDVVIRLAERYERLLEAVAATDFTCTRPQDGYQKRCLSFFAERFVGYALLQELLQMGKVSRLPEGGITMAGHNIGYCCTVAAGGVAPESYEIGRQ